MQEELSHAALRDDVLLFKVVQKEKTLTHQLILQNTSGLSVIEEMTHEPAQTPQAMQINKF